MNASSGAFRALPDGCCATPRRQLCTKAMTRSHIFCRKTNLWITYDTFGPLIILEYFGIKKQIGMFWNQFALNKLILLGINSYHLDISYRHNDIMNAPWSLDTTRIAILCHDRIALLTQVPESSPIFSTSSTIDLLLKYLKQLRPNSESLDGQNRLYRETVKPTTNIIKHHLKLFRMK